MCTVLTFVVGSMTSVKSPYKAMRHDTYQKGSTTGDELTTERMPVIVTEGGEKKLQGVPKLSCKWRGTNSYQMFELLKLST